jgi:TolB protein
LKHIQGIMGKTSYSGYGSKIDMKSKKRTIKFSKLFGILLIILIVAVVFLVGWPYFGIRFQQTISDTLSGANPLSDSITGNPEENGDQNLETGENDLSALSNVVLEQMQFDGIIVFSMADGLNNSLFLYHPQYMTYKRITNPASDDIDPAINPMGTSIAFSSKRNGYWDIYLLNMSDGSLQRITDSADFEGHPSWSPDGKWIVYEKYAQNNFDIFLQNMENLADPPINLTQSEANEFSPNWSPEGRLLTFVSDADGSDDVWIADLNSTDERFTNISRSYNIDEKNPVWMPTGNAIAWSAPSNYYSTIFKYDLTSKEIINTGMEGDRFMWSPDTKSILSIMNNPNGNAINIYQNNGNNAFPTRLATKNISGLDWIAGDFVNAVLSYPFAEYTDAPTSPLFEADIDANPAPPSGRFAVVELSDVNVPYPFLHDLANESFENMRFNVARKTGWDVLNSLENAFIPITVPTEIWHNENWFYTGRAISISSSAMDAGWMTIVKEEIGGKVYWRVYVKCRYQDGSQGKPLKMRAFDLSARSSGDPEIYDKGGEYTIIPSGYWVDFTELAYRYEWERLPASVGWETYYPAARFSIFIFRQNIDWSHAMQEIIPDELIPTPSYSDTDFESNVHPAVSTNGEPITETNPSVRPTWTPVPGLNQP